MKKIIALIIVFSISFIFFDINMVYAKQYTESSRYDVIKLRAGGGSGGSSGGGTGSSSSGGSGGHVSSTGSRGYYGPFDIIGNIISYIFYIFIFLILSSTAIILYIKVLKSSIHSRKYLKILKSRDLSWDYNMIRRQVIDTFYIVQEAWTNMNMDTAKEYMDSDLYDSFNIKLEWMKYNKKRNVLKKIKLLNIKPVSVYDDLDDSRDLIWFYVKGRMVDYMINTQTNEKIDGKSYSTSFVEFWKFVRDDNNRWVLSKIRQQNEFDTINFY